MADPFISKGRLIIPRFHRASFNGKHDRVKAKVYLYLWVHKYQFHQEGGLTLSEIHWETGVNYNYLRSKAGKWEEWGFVTRRAIIRTRQRPVYSYQIGERGVHFLRDIMPPDVRRQLTDEINEWRKNRRLTM